MRTTNSVCNTAILMLAAVLKPAVALMTAVVLMPVVAERKVAREIQPPTLFNNRFIGITSGQTG